jgi:chromosome segregation ATPase
MRGNAGELLVLVNDDLTGTVAAEMTRPGRAARSGQTRAVKVDLTGQEEELERLRAELARVTAERDQLRAEELETRERIGRAEERVAGRDALLEELRRQLDWCHKPWWRKLWP